jgi:anaerobic magnesium-protoporphyrin IX monomethyl ester cyclase
MLSIEGDGSAWFATCSPFSPELYRTMKILLIRPPIAYVDFSTGFFPFSIYTMFMTRYPPMGLMYLASLLRQDGHRVALLDAEAEELDVPSAYLRMKPFQPDLIVGNVNIYNSYKNFEDLIRLKEDLRARLVVRGHFPGQYPEETIARPEVDVVMTGKGFTSITGLARALEQGEDLEPVKGIWFRRNGEVVRTPVEGPLRDLDLLPFPARDLVDQRLYVTNLSYRRPFTTMFASLGCPYNCTYCTDRKVPYSSRSVASVMAELEECAGRFGIREVAFLDPTFTVRRQWVMDLCRSMKLSKLDLTFTMRTRADLLDQEMVQALAEAGCVRISLGIESGDPEILKTMNRVPDLTLIERAVSWIHKEGIMAFGYFMIGNKGETHQSLERTLRFTARLPLHFAQFFQTIPLLGTEVLENSKEHFGYDIWLRISRGHYPSPDEFRSHQTALTLEDLKKWSRRLYLNFYLHPRRWRYLLTLKYLPAYLLRQLEILFLVGRLVALRRIRHRYPAFLLSRYPHAKNGGPGFER